MISLLRVHIHNAVEGGSLICSFFLYASCSFISVCTVMLQIKNNNNTHCNMIIYCLPVCMSAAILYFGRSMSTDVGVKFLESGDPQNICIAAGTSLLWSTKSDTLLFVYSYSIWSDTPVSSLQPPSRISVARQVALYLDIDMRWAVYVWQQRPKIWLLPLTCKSWRLNENHAGVVYTASSVVGKRVNLKKKKRT